MTRTAFTAIEIMVVVSVVAVLGMVSVTGLGSSMRALAVDRASNTIIEAARTARALALRADQPRDEAKRYGLVLIDATASVPASVAITYGSDATVAHILLGTDGEPVFQRFLTRGAVYYVAPTDGDTPQRLAGETGWMFQYDTGLTTVRAVSHLTPTFIGMPAVRITEGGLTLAASERRHAAFVLGDEQRNLRLGLSATANGVLSSTPWRD